MAPPAVGTYVSVKVGGVIVVIVAGFIAVLKAALTI
jgi:hypothetical protein